MNKKENLEKNKEKLECEHCLQQKDDVSNYEEHKICDSCIDLLPNPTGYCSISCRLGNGCDDSC